MLVCFVIFLSLFFAGFQWSCSFQTLHMHIVLCSLLSVSVRKNNDRPSARGANYDVARYAGEQHDV